MRANEIPPSAIGNWPSLVTVIINTFTMVDGSMQINGGPTRQGVTVTPSEFGAKFKSKGEVYYFLTVEVGAYLPPKDAISIYFLKDLITGKRQCKSFFLL